MMPAPLEIFLNIHVRLLTGFVILLSMKLLSVRKFAFIDVILWVILFLDFVSNIDKSISIQKWSSQYFFIQFIDAYVRVLVWGMLRYRKTSTTDIIVVESDQ